MTETPAKLEVKPVDLEIARRKAPPEQLVRDLVEEWASLADDLSPGTFEAA